MTAKTYYVFKPEPGMVGPYALDVSTIARVVGEKDYGVYVLVHKSENDNLIVVYVGRGIIKQRLTAHVTGKDAHGFYFKKLDDDDDAGFAEECRLYHRYGKRPYLDNKQHPDVPDDSPDSYPRCTVKGCNGTPD